MSRASDRPAWEQDGKEAPVPHRLPPAHKKVKAGCWSTALLILLALALLGCGIADGVRKFAEPIDRGGCRVSCELAGEDFVTYAYETDSCWCQTANGSLVER